MDMNPDTHIEFTSGAVEFDTGAPNTKRSASIPPLIE